MALRYSTYEAKAKIGEVIRRVREGQRIVIAYRGKDVAEIQPIKEPVRETLEERIRRHRRGADLWHLACALWIAPDARGLAFVTLDKRQREVARKLGFAL